MNSKDAINPVFFLVLAAAFWVAVYLHDPIRAEEGYWIGAKMLGGAIVGQAISWFSARLAMAREISIETIYKSRMMIIAVCIAAASLGG